MSKRVAINGFGRIGRLAFRHMVDSDDLEVVALNDIAPLDNLVYLLKHDSVHADPLLPVEAQNGTLRWGDKQIAFTSIRNVAELPWEEKNVDLVVESTGLFTKREEAAQHLEAGAHRVIISAPGKGVDLTVCMGVNADKFEPDKHTVISNASCTTNCLAPVAKVLDEEFGIVTGFLTTVHAFTSSQGLVDQPSKKWRRGRSAPMSIVPTTTGAAIATTRVLPQLEGKMDGLAMRVPVPNGSIIDFVVQTEELVSVEKVNEAFRRAAQLGPLQGILGITEDELVSADVVGSNLSALIDAQSTMVLGDHTVKVLAWYDNEWGYAKRLADLTSYVAERT